MFVWAVANLVVAYVEVLFLAFLGILVASILNYPVSFLSRWIPRALAAVVVMLVVLGMIAGMFILSYPLVTRQAGALAQRIPEALDHLQAWFHETIRAAPLAPATERQIAIEAKTELGARLAALVDQVLSWAMTIVTAVSAAILLFVLALFLSYDPRAYVAGILKLVPRGREETVSGFLERIGTTLTGWMLGTFVGMTIIGTGTALGLLLFGVEGWLVLGAVAFFGEFVPYLGPVVSAIPGIAIALVESPRKALWVGLFYLGLQQFEGYVVAPIVMRRAVRLQPALLLVWQLAMGAAFGFLGIFVATPLLACAKAAVEYFWIERRLAKGT